MPATVTLFRQELQALLADAYGFEFKGGRLDAPQEDKPIGCVWHEGKRWWQRDGNESEVYYRIRVFPTFRVPQGTTTDAASVTLLEEHEELLETTLAPVLVSLAGTAGHQFFTLQEVNVDQDGQFVEGQIRAYQRNLGARGG